MAAVAAKFSTVGALFKVSARCVAVVKKFSTLAAKFVLVTAKFAVKTLKFTVKEQSHNQTKYQQLLLKPWLVKPNPSVQCLSLGREGRACSVMRYAGTGYPILGTYVTAVVIIKLKRTANPCEVVAEVDRQ